jgi:chorismate dehydratase
MHRLRISAISYLNTAPLMWDFENTQVGSQFDIAYTIPSDCARELADGSADIGIIPAAAYTTIPDLVILPDVAIAAKRAVRSILLVSKVPIGEIRSVALDTSSMTSVALTKVILQRWLAGQQHFTAMRPDLSQMLSRHDAALLIGDPALQVDRSKYHAYDLAEEWIARTGKPFVFAFWAVRKAALENMEPSLNLATIFQRSRTHGLEPGSVDQIARNWAARLRLREDEVKTYLLENIHYYLDGACLEGLKLFYRYAQMCGALPDAPGLRFLEVPKTVGL